jgi:hypothetical protein
MACYPHASSEFSVAWLIKMPCALPRLPDPSIRRRPRATRKVKASHTGSTAAGSLAVSQRASEAFAHQNLIYDVDMNNGDDQHAICGADFVGAIEANTCLAKCAAERFRTQISSA